MKGIHKIGLTTHPIKQRIDQLSTTGVPSRFQVETLHEVPEKDLQSFEREVHKKLKRQKKHHGKEFFKCSRSDCIDAIQSVYIAKYGTSSVDLIEKKKERDEKLRKELERKEALEKEHRNEIHRLNREQQRLRDQFIEDNSQKLGLLNPVWPLLSFF